MPREPTRQQVSSRLAYSSSTPAFLQRLQAQVSRQTGRRVGDVDYDEDEPQVEFESLDADRPAIPVRPRSPKPDDDAAKDTDEEPEDERPQVVVLKEGKHLTTAQVENEKRIAQGLPPLPAASAEHDASREGTAAPKDGGQELKRKQAAPAMSFSSSSSKKAGPAGKASAAKRRAADLNDGEDGATRTTTKVKKAKKNDRKLLSFGEDG